MKKAIALIFVLILAVGSLTAYLILSEKIIAGNLRIADGERQLAQGQLMLANGKNRLTNGEKELSSAKKFSDGIKYSPVLSVAILPVSLGVMGVTHAKISQGDKQVAAGREKIRNGERQLAAGKIELQKGILKIAFANKIRLACGIAAIVFFALWIGLVYCWRRSFVVIFQRKS